MKIGMNQSRPELTRSLKEVPPAFTGRHNNDDVIATEVSSVADKHDLMCEKVMQRLTTKRRLLCA